MGQILMLGMCSEDDATEPLELRTLADWVVRQRLLTIPGVAQVFTMGGGRKQFQILVDPEKLLRFGVSLQQVKDAVVSSNENATGGYLDQQGPNELLVRALGRVQTIEDMEQIVVTIREGRPVTLAQIAQVTAGAAEQTRRQCGIRTCENRRRAEGVVRRIMRRPDHQQAAGRRHACCDGQSCSRRSRTECLVAEGHSRDSAVFAKVIHRSSD